MTIKTPKGRKVVSIARKVIRRVHDLAPVHRSIKRDIRKIHRLQSPHRDKLRTFGVPRQGTRMHRATAVKKPKTPRAARTYRKPRTI